MGASIQVEKNSSLQSVNLSLVESVAQNRKRILQAERIITRSLVGLEYFLYVFAFFVLFNYKIVPYYSDFYLFSPVTWKNSDVFGDYIFLLVLVLFIYSVMIFRKGLFELYREKSFLDEIFNMIKSLFVSFLISLGVLFMLKTSIVYSRIFMVVFAFLVLLISVTVRSIKVLIITYMKRNNIYSKNVVIIGAGKIGDRVYNLLTSNQSNGYKVVGYLDDFKHTHENGQVVGKINDLEAIIHKFRVNEIFITIPSERKLLNDILVGIRKYDVAIKIIPEMFDFVTTTVNFQNSSTYPYLEIVKTPLRGGNLFLKRLVDISLSSFGLFLFSPVLILVALIIKLDSKGPVFFKQRRIGINGVPFNMYKFRSMVINAEALKKELSKLNEAEGPVFKIKEDPRITKVGKFIRKYSIDELPQLLNVFKGDMSLIGPRPPLPNEVEQYNDLQWRRLDIRPGITGLWQVSGRSDLSFDEWVNLDIYYIENWSVIFDIKILLRTVPVVLRGNGSY